LSTSGLNTSHESQDGETERHGAQRSGIVAETWRHDQAVDSCRLDRGNVAAERVIRRLTDPGQELSLARTDAAADHDALGRHGQDEHGEQLAEFIGDIVPDGMVPSELVGACPGADCAREDVS